MAWLVPYVINGAAHSAALFRRQAQRPATDQVGVSRPGDLKVTQLPAAATGFRIAQGGLSLPSRFPGRGRESYGVENGDAVIDVTDVPGTGSSARRDAVVVEVLDPNYMAVTHEDAALTNYMKVHVVQGVAAGAKTIGNIASFNNRTAYVLAFINWPANTTAITNAMIQDVRELANPKRTEVVYARPRIGADESSGQQFLTVKDSTGGEYFPGGAGSPNEFTVDIPLWATRMVIDAKWITVLLKGNPWGSCWIEYGDEYRAHTWPNKQQYEFTTQKFGFHSPATTDEKSANFLVMDEVPIPAKLRGKRITFVFKASRRDESQINSSHQVRMLWDSGLGCRITFAESALDSDLI